MKQLFDLLRRTHLFSSILILSPALNKVSVKYTFGHFLNTYWMKPHTVMDSFLYEGH